MCASLNQQFFFSFWAQIISYQLQGSVATHFRCSEVFTDVGLLITVANLQESDSE